MVIEVESRREFVVLVMVDGNTLEQRIIHSEERNELRIFFFFETGSYPIDQAGLASVM